MNYEEAKNKYPDAIRMVGTLEEDERWSDAEVVKWQLYGDKPAKLLSDTIKGNKRELIFSAMAVREEVAHG